MHRCVLCLTSERLLDVPSERVVVHSECVLNLVAALQDDPKAFAIALFNSGFPAGETNWMHTLYRELIT